MAACLSSLFLFLCLVNILLMKADDVKDYWQGANDYDNNNSHGSNRDGVWCCVKRADEALSILRSVFRRNPGISNEASKRTLVQHIRYIVNCKFATSSQTDIVSEFTAFVKQR